MTETQARIDLALCASGGRLTAATVSSAGTQRASFVDLPGGPVVFELPLCLARRGEDGWLIGHAARRAYLTADAWIDDAWERLRASSEDPRNTPAARDTDSEDAHDEHAGHGDPTDEVWRASSDDASISPRVLVEQIAAQFGHVARAAVARLDEPHRSVASIARVRIAVPSAWDDRARAMLRNCARLAGLVTVEVVSAGQALCDAAVRSTPDRGAMLACELHADRCAVRVFDADREAGVARLRGQVEDGALSDAVVTARWQAFVAERIDRERTRDGGASPRAWTRLSAARIRHAAMTALATLASEERVELPLAHLWADESGPRSLTLALSRGDVDAQLRDLEPRLRALVDAALDRAALDEAAITEVFALGPGFRVAALADALERRFGLPIEAARCEDAVLDALAGVLAHGSNTTPGHDATHAAPLGEAAHPDVRDDLAQIPGPLAGWLPARIAEAHAARTADHACARVRALIDWHARARELLSVEVERVRALPQLASAPLERWTAWAAARPEGPDASIAAAALTGLEQSAHDYAELLAETPDLLRQALSRPIGPPVPRPRDPLGPREGAAELGGDARDDADEASNEPMT